LVLRGKGPVFPASWAKTDAGAANVSAAATRNDFVDILQYQPDRAAPEGKTTILLGPWPSLYRLVGRRDREDRVAHRAPPPLGMPPEANRFTSSASGCWQCVRNVPTSPRAVRLLREACAKCGVGPQSRAAVIGLRGGSPDKLDMNIDRAQK
jgi:hypothetical protein